LTETDLWFGFSNNENIPHWLSRKESIMHRYTTIKSFISCAFGAVVIAGCASPPAEPAKVVSSEKVQSGKVIEVSSMHVELPKTSSGSSSGTVASGMANTSETKIVTVQFDDGTQNRYMLLESAPPFVAGEPVKVITDTTKGSIGIAR
jgi:hypothetical protein